MLIEFANAHGNAYAFFKCKETQAFMRLLFLPQEISSIFLVFLMCLD